MGVHTVGSAGLTLVVCSTPENCARLVLVYCSCMKMSFPADIFPFSILHISHWISFWYARFPTLMAVYAIQLAFYQ